ncbi:MAG: PAS domain S-box protein [Spirochaetaceae bacterium]|nr:MAG: PAS domain S-box protein [Spirochaetaceae bacterium]
MMDRLSVFLITRDPGILDDLRTCAEQRSLPYDLERHWPHPHIARDEAEQRSTVFLIELADSAANTIDLIRSYPNNPALVIARAGSEDAVCALHMETGCEFVIRDDEGRYVSLLPTLIRKVLRERDREETAGDMLRSSEHRYEELIQAIPDVVYKIDPSGHFLFVNEAVRALGYAPEELIGRHFSEMLVPEEVPRVSRNQMLSRMRGTITGPQSAPGLFDERRTGERRTRGLEVRLRTKGNGGDLVGSVSAFGEIAATGHYHADIQRRFFTGTVGIIRDITPRKRAERMLQRLSIAVEQSRAAICITEPDGIVVYANPHFFRLNRFRPEEFIGQNMFVLMQDYVQEETVEEITRAIKSETVWEGDTIVWRGDGESYWSWMKVFPIVGGSGDVSDFVFFQEDITDRKQSETFLRERVRDQDDLLRDMHEQTKTCIEVIEGLVSMRAAGLRGTPAEREFEAVIAQVRAVSAVMRGMIVGTTPPLVNLDGFLNQEFPQVCQALNVPPEEVTAEIDLSIARVSAQVAVPLAVALDQIVTVLIGFGQVRYLQLVGGSENDESWITISHGGRDHLSAPEHALAVRIVEAMAMRMDGTFTHRDGASYRLTFQSTP